MATLEANCGKTGYGSNLIEGLCKRMNENMRALVEDIDNLRVAEKHSKVSNGRTFS